MGVSLFLGLPFATLLAVSYNLEEECDSGAAFFLVESEDWR
jgi:hypothetical protein